MRVAETPVNGDLGRSRPRQYGNAAMHVALARCAGERGGGEEPCAWMMGHHRRTRVVAPPETNPVARLRAPWPLTAE
jgi:hypothetical protein